MNPIKRIRKKLSLSQEIFGEMIDVSRIMVSKYERNLSLPSLKTYDKIIKLCLKNNINIDYKSLINNFKN